MAVEMRDSTAEKIVEFSLSPESSSSSMQSDDDKEVDCDEEEEEEDTDSGMKSDGYNLWDVGGEVGTELCQVGDQTCSVPLELYDLPDLSQVLSLDVWNDCLTDEEKFGLCKYLPDMDEQTFMRTLMDLLSGSNLFFGNPVKRFSEMLRGGLCEPQVSLPRQGLMFFQKQQYYHYLRNYQNDMVCSLVEIKDTWTHRNIYAIEDKIKIFNDVRSRRSPENQHLRCRGLKYDSSHKDEPGQSLSSPRMTYSNGGQLYHDESLSCDDGLKNVRGLRKLADVRQKKTSRNDQRKALSMRDPMDDRNDAAIIVAEMAGLKDHNMFTSMEKSGVSILKYKEGDGDIGGGRFGIDAFTNQNKSLKSRGKRKFSQIFMPKSHVEPPSMDPCSNDDWNTKSKRGKFDRVPPNGNMNSNGNSSPTSSEFLWELVPTQRCSLLKKKGKKGKNYIKNLDDTHLSGASPQLLEIDATTNLDNHAAKKEIIAVEPEPTPKKKTYTPITPTVDCNFTFSVIHLLSAVRIALITPYMEDNLVIQHDEEDNGSQEVLVKIRGVSNGIDSCEKAEASNVICHEQVNVPTFSIQEIINRVKTNPGDPFILETMVPLQDLIRGVLKIFSSKTAPLGAKGWKPLAKYERSTKSWSWIDPSTDSSPESETVEEVTSPAAWGLPHRMLVKLVDAFANWLRSGQETLRLIGSLPPPPASLVQFNIEAKDRLKDLRIQKSLNTISPSSEEVRDYFRKEEFIRYSIPDRAFTYTTADGRKSTVAPLRRGGGKPSSKARDHFMLKSDRPPHVTILCLVRDAAARLPGSIGTRADVATLMRDSQYIAEDVTDAQVNQILGGALDRLHYEHDPCVKFEQERKLWVYLHRDREEDDFDEDCTLSTKKWKKSKNPDQVTDVDASYVPDNVPEGLPEQVNAPFAVQPQQYMDINHEVSMRDTLWSPAAAAVHGFSS